MKIVVEYRVVGAEIANRSEAFHFESDRADLHEAARAAFCALAESETWLDWNRSGAILDVAFVGKAGSQYRFVDADGMRTGWGVDAEDAAFRVAFLEARAALQRSLGRSWRMIPWRLRPRPSFPMPLDVLDAMDASDPAVKWVRSSAI